MDLALNNLQRLICHKTQQTKPEIIEISQSSHKMYSNNIVNFQESMTIQTLVQKSLETY